MSDFKCEVMRIDAVENHPNADRLKIVKIRGFNCISGNLEDGSARYKEGDLVVYIPEGAVLPEPMLKACGFWDEANNKGLMAGPLGDRVKAVKLRGVVSQGILYPVVALTDTQKRYYGTDTDGLLHLPNDLVDGYLKFYNVKVGDDVASYIGATKYIPTIPTHMSGEVTYVGRENTVNFDVENIQKYPDIFKEGEMVIITEKLHGTFCGFGYTPNNFWPDIYNVLGDWSYPKGSYFAFSKGLGAQGMAFKHNDANAVNLYHKTLLVYLDAFKKLIAERWIVPHDTKIYVLGEIYGKGVQDLHYGLSEPKFRVFAIVLKDKAGNTTYVRWGEIENLCLDIFETVPVLYRGPFSHEIVASFRDGETSLTQGQIREGIVIVPAEERDDPQIGRVALKAVSPDYLFRKGNATEYN